MSAARPRRRRLVPEVVQTSGMDCGPACLSALVEGFGIPASYGRLREACHTDVDGTSIDALETVAGQLGLAAEQVMVPVDALLLPEARALPAIVVVRLPNGFTHFVVVWRRHGPWVQVMDPAVGRRWLRAERLLRDVYVHAACVPAGAWREWAGSPEFTAVLARRMAELGIGAAAARELIDAAGADPGWRPLATLDAAVRLTASVVSARAVRRGAQAERFLRHALHRAEAGVETEVIPASSWSVRPVAGGPREEEELRVQGAVLVRALSTRAASGEAGAGGEILPAEVAAAAAQPEPSPLRAYWRLMAADGRRHLALVGGAVLAAAATVALEALVLRGAAGLGRTLGLFEQRLAAAGAFALFLVLLVTLEASLGASVLRLGRRAELRLRHALLARIPRLDDRYVQSRPASDMAERTHAMHQLRLFPRLAASGVQLVAQMVITAAALWWLAPGAPWLAAGIFAASIGIPLLFLPVIQEQDLRLRTHNGALSRFYLDALMGLLPIRSHAAADAVAREHESLLVEAVRTARQRLAATGLFIAVHAVVTAALLAMLLLRQAALPAEGAGALLLAYWAVQLQTNGIELVFLLQQYPAFRNIALRVLEPLGAPVPDAAAAGAPGPPSTPTGAAVRLEAVAVTAAGHTVLEGISLQVQPGEHVAVVGPSGAGKSTLLGLLLGWHQPAAGAVRVDGRPLDPAALEALRAETVWVDPSVHLWNRTLLENLLYGSDAAAPAHVGEALAAAELHGVLERLPDGLQTPLGDGGGLLSGGEGQRVRLGRGMLRGGVRLLLLDEPFRGLDREQRARLLAAVRERWSGATVVCVTHDLEQTLDFDRVIVLEGGRLVEDGAPAALRHRPGSRYRELLQAECDARTAVWMNPVWRRLRLAGGRLAERAEERVP
ncbi:MAG TPA: ATP-binding cassette domain-containing protein [Longimicrobium sp.]|nr:ATP-binding cassette domain-containing protein [Longimicrobium sp.]